MFVLVCGCFLYTVSLSKDLMVLYAFGVIAKSLDAAQI